MRKGAKKKFGILIEVHVYFVTQMHISDKEHMI